MSEHDEQPTARWTRERLDAYATERGIDPVAFNTKDDLVAAIQATATDEPDEVAALGDEDNNAPEPMPTFEVEPARYRVLKAITLADGSTLMPGDEFAPDETFPARRPGQLVRQKFLRAINDQARAVAKTAATEEDDDDGAAL